MTDSIPWPDENKGLFVQGGNYYEFSHFGWGDIWTQFYGYSMGYKESADLIIESALESRDISRLDTVVFPAFFLYRQFIELSLKQAILAYSQQTLSEKVGMIKKLNHDLERIWKEYRILLPSPIDENEEKVLRIVEGYILEFSKMDKSSFSFRYPVTKDLTLIFGEEKRINLRHVMDRMAELNSFFNCAFVYMEEFRATEAELRMEFESELFDDEYY